MEPYSEGKQALARVQPRHIFFRKKTGNAVCIQFGLRDVSVNRVLKISHDNNVVFFFGHVSFPGKLADRSFLINTKNTKFAHKKDNKSPHMKRLIVDMDDVMTGVTGQNHFSRLNNWAEIGDRFP